MIVPWRDQNAGLKFRFGFEGYQPAVGEENPTCRLRPISPRFFAVLGVPILAGRDFTDDDRTGTELVAMISQSLAQRMFPNGEAVNRRLWFFNPDTLIPRRIIGVVAAETDAEAHFLATSLQQSFVNLRTGHPGPLPPPVEGYFERLDPGAQAMLNQAFACAVVGSPATVAAGLAAFAQRTGADELMITGSVFDHAKRLRSFEIAAQACGVQASS